MDKQSWYDLGPADIFSQSTEVLAGNTRLAVTWQGGKFGVISGVCNHAVFFLVEHAIAIGVGRCRRFGRNIRQCRFQFLLNL